MFSGLPFILCGSFDAINVILAIWKLTPMKFTGKLYLQSPNYININILFFLLTVIFSTHPLLIISNNLCLTFKRGSTITNRTSPTALTLHANKISPIPFHSPPISTLVN